MIDIESELFTEIATILRNQFPCYVSNVYVRRPPSFPAIFIEEADNATVRATQDSKSGENTVEVMYEVNVFSDRDSGKKAECKRIMAVIGDWFLQHNFNRVMQQPLPNLDDATIYRLTARYRGQAGKNKIMYRR